MGGLALNKISVQFGLKRRVLAKTMPVPSINFIDPQTLVFQILGVLVFQLLQKVPNTGLVTMTTITMDCRNVSWPRQWLCQVST